MNDATTAFLAFAALFAGIAAYLVRLDLAARRLEARLARLESGTAKGKKDAREGGPQG